MQDFAQARTGFRPAQCVAPPADRIVNVDVLGDDIEVAAQDERVFAGQQFLRVLTSRSSQSSLKSNFAVLAGLPFGRVE